MSSIFRKDDNFVDKPNRNPFDLSFQNNLTTKFGVLKPVYCQEVIPGDTMKINPTLAMRFMPQVFPVQTRMRAHLHFFYVRNRNLWKDWEDFIGKTKDGLVPPYLQFNDINRDMLKVGGICDSFGVPVVSNSDVLQATTYSRVTSDNSKQEKYYNFYNNTISTSSFGVADYSLFQDGEFGNLSSIYRTSTTNRYTYAFPFANGVVLSYYKDDYDVEFSDFTINSEMVHNAYLVLEVSDSEGNLFDFGYRLSIAEGENSFSIPRILEVQNPDTTGSIYMQYTIQKVKGIIFASGGSLTLSFSVIPSSISSGVDVYSIPFGDSFPYWNQNSSTSDNALKISALPFRGYEAIYNSFYRNAENNPLIIDGVPEYNKYNRTYEGGADTNNYELFNRNWEDDFLTTALPSPQQGTAPLVGIVNRGDAPYIVTLSDEDGNQSRVKFTYQNGSVQVSSDDEVSQEVAGQLNEYFMETTNVGISIQDFRNVNSFQRWLENNIRKGFKYRDQIKGHFGVSVRYDILDMPEFIGGVSRDVSVQQVTQTSAGSSDSDGNLGDYAGQAYAYGEGETISHYCDEHGYIIGILSVVPMANYSQMMPKHLMKRDAFDYYFPEFGKIGMQPILNKEVTTLESIARGNQDEVFGYQRAWYDYIARVDEVHGLFTTNLRNFLIGRTFKDVPQLSAQFSTIQNDQLNNIFYVDDDADKILGQIYFNVTGIRPIPVFGIPSIE